MKIELRSIGNIRPYENNPRINEDAVDAVAASIREFGFRQPIVVDSDGVIIVGHTRYKAAKKLGLTEVPVHVATDLTPEQIRAYRIADNKTAELAEWNYDLLPIELSQLGEAGFNLQLLGFDQEELAQLLDPGVKDGLTDPDEVPEPPDAAITQPGDLWILGDHRLLCGDSGNPVHVEYAMPSRGIDALPGVMCQHDFEGRRLFQHRNMRKWSFYHNPATPRFEYEEDCLRLLDELKAKWSPVAQTLPSNDDLAAIAAMDGRTYEYHRIGHDHRPLAFRGDGTFAKGQAGCERYWTIRDGRLLIAGDDGRLTMDLQARPDGGWEGRWLVHEKMPILLEPKP